MRLLRLDLRAFGPFTNVVLDLSGGKQGLHVIYGPNEAGKTSALRAVDQLFFGIPARSTDAFLHSYANLRVGALIADRSGKCLEFLRRKAAKNSLLAADNLTPIADSTLAALLGHVDRDLFRRMFGIDHAELVNGGKEIVRGSGDVGQLLFAAGSGIADLRSVRENLKKEADKLFLARGSAPSINQKLALLREERARIREAQLPSEEWAKHDQALRDAQENLAATERDLREMVSQRNRLERIRQALPIIARWRDRQGEIVSLGEVVLLPADFAERRRQAETRLTVAENRARAAGDEVQRIDRQLARLDIPERLLALADTIRQLPEALGSYRKAQRDLPSLHSAASQQEAEAAATLRRLRPDLPPAEVDRLRLTRAQERAIGDLGLRRGALTQKLDKARQEVEESDGQLRSAEEQLAGLEEPRDTTTLADALQRIQKQGDLDQKRAAAASEWKQVEQQSAVELARLGQWSGTLDELEKLAVPSLESLQRFEDELAEMDQELRSLQKDLKKTISDRADHDRRLEKLRLEADVPSQSDVAAARRLRDEGWQLVVAAWQQGGPDSQRLAEFLGHFPADLLRPGLLVQPEGATGSLPAPASPARADKPPVAPAPLSTRDSMDLAAAYGAAVHAADDLADRLRREAQRVAERANLESGRDALDHRLAELGQQIAAAQSRRSQSQRAWSECWRPLGVEPQSPREMRSWLQCQQSLAQQAAQIRLRRGLVAGIDECIRGCRAELEQCLHDLLGGFRLPDGTPPPVVVSTESLSTLMGRCQSVLEQERLLAATRQQVTKELKQHTARLGAARAGVEKAEAELSQWQDQWAAAIRSLGLPPETSPQQANDWLAELKTVFTLLEKAADFRDRIEKIGLDTRAFFDQVEDAARQVDADSSGLPPNQRAEQLSARLQRALADQQKQESLQEQRARYHEEREAACREVEDLTARLETACREAGCPGRQELPGAERASDRARQLRASLDDLKDQILALGGGASIEPFLAEAQAVNADDLPGQIDQLTDQIGRRELERDEVLKIRTGEEIELRKIDSSGAAAEAAQRVQDLLAQIGGDAPQYVRLRLASLVLQGAIERYRRKNEGPILRRASELFCRLTRRSFERLVADVNEKGENVLVGLRPGGQTTVDLAGMSDGTCDQLYLALRLASLEHYLSDKEPLPLIVDDILVGFDDDRCRVALEVLGDLSRQTQVLLFTHHRHLVRLAEASLPAEVLFVHELAGSPPN
jgi:uncharacterized protein YhaN